MSGLGKGVLKNRVMGCCRDRVMGGCHDRVMGACHDRVMGACRDRVMGACAGAWPALGKCVHLSDATNAGACT